jgi:predicted Zn-dependent protease
MTPLKLLATALVLAMFSACATSPEGRRQLHLLPEAQLDAMGEQSFAELKTTTPMTDKANVRNYVQCIANQIIPQLAEDNNPAAWEVQVFADDQANAFALPGRKIGVYEGLLKYAQNQHQLAAVMGHELAHVIAEHGNERVSSQLAANAGMSIAAIVLGSTESDNSMLMAGLGLGVQYGVLMPFSRSHESEADLIGLDLMAKSGFDPRESVTLWQNMSKAGGSGPEFLSTHPSGDTRIKDLTGRMSKAMTLYNNAQNSGKKPNCSL